MTFVHCVHVIILCCSDILGRLEGSATDAAAATLLCIGVVNMQDTGLGGGNIMTIYDTYVAKVPC